MIKKITVVGLGAGGMEQLPFGVYKLLKNTTKIYVRTKEHPLLVDLEKEGVTFTSFDYLYEEETDFEDVYVAITDKLIDEVKKAGEIIYAVPGHPLVAERTVQLLLEREKDGGFSVKISGGQSFLDGMFTALKIDPIEGFQLLDGTMLRSEDLQIRQHMIIAQVYDRFVASEVKLTLMEKLPDDYEVFIVTAAGSADEHVEKVPLYELDRVATISNLTAVYVPPVKDEQLLYRQFEKLRDVVRTLRGPNGCPWDKKQTHESLKKYLLEECYELLEAIDEKDPVHIVEELGDVLLQVMLHAQIGEDEGLFSIEDVIEVLTRKMIRRHPHVFDDKHVDDANEVITQWEEIKKEEKGEDETESILANIPATLPSLLKAYELQKKAATVGFDWKEVKPIWDKLKEEIDEWLVEIREGTKEEAEKELGDLLFVIVNLARFYQLNPELALIQTNNKFMKRFQYIEKKVHDMGKKMTELSLEELDAIWDEAKKLE